MHSAVLCFKKNVYFLLVSTNIKKRRGGGLKNCIFVYFDTILYDPNTNSYNTKILFIFLPIKLQIPKGNGAKKGKNNNINLNRTARTTTLTLNSKNIKLKRGFKLNYKKRKNAILKKADLLLNTCSCDRI